MSNPDLLLKLLAVSVDASLGAKIERAVEVEQALPTKSKTAPALKAAHKSRPA
jgi:hypothetical protein